MEGTSIARAADHSNGSSATEIPLAAASPQPVSLGKRGRKLWERANKREIIKPEITAGRLLVNHGALVVDAGAELGGRLEIPWYAIRKAVVDDGSRWGYVAAVCRFPVYAVRSDGSGSGTLIGPLWSRAAALLPAGSPVVEIDPVPEQSPNLVLIFDPGIAARPPQGDGDRRGDGNSIVGMLLRTDNPAAARTAIASRIEIGDLDHDDLEYLNRAASLTGSGNEASATGASGNGASAADGSGSGAPPLTDDHVRGSARASA
jgi:hypothetical protein